MRGSENMIEKKRWNVKTIIIATLAVVCLLVCMNRFLLPSKYAAYITGVAEEAGLKDVTVKVEPWHSFGNTTVYDIYIDCSNFATYTTTSMFRIDDHIRGKIYFWKFGLFEGDDNEMYYISDGHIYVVDREIPYTITRDGEYIFGKNYNAIYGGKSEYIRQQEKQKQERQEEEKRRKIQEELKALQKKNGSSGTSGSSWKSDVYDVYDYDDPDDFADEWEDEFDSWDDAFAYWEDHN